MASPEVCVCSSSDGDSALSTIANIISILTFAYVLVIGGLFQVASYRRANYNFSGLRDRAADLRKQAREIQALYRQRADKLPGAKAWDLTAEAIKTANSLSKDLEKAEKRASSKWYLVWQEVTFKSAKERSAWEQELDEAFMILSLDRLFIEGGFHGDLGGLDAQQLAYLENRPEDLKRLRQLMNEFQVSLLRLLRPYAVDKRMVRQQGDSESIDGINFLLALCRMTSDSNRRQGNLNLHAHGTLLQEIVQLREKLFGRTRDSTNDTAHADIEPPQPVERSKSMGAYESESGRYKYRTPTWPTPSNQHHDEAQLSARMTWLPPREAGRRTAPQAAGRTELGAGNSLMLDVHFLFQDGDSALSTTSNMWESSHLPMFSLLVACISFQATSRRLLASLSCVPD